jgi:molybdopterin synthase catalytic subunit
MPTISVQQEDFDAGREIAAVRAKNPKVGAVASFIGVVRDVNDGAAGLTSVATMTLEHYPGMTEKALGKIVDEAAGRWEVLDQAPFWKKEETPEGARWVEAKDSDDVAAGRWK